jgi:hypothetical protein
MNVNRNPFLLDCGELFELLSAFTQHDAGTEIWAENGIFIILLDIEIACLCCRLSKIGKFDNRSTGFLKTVRLDKIFY